MSMIYEPREDSELLKRHIGKYAKGKVLDMGTGSGVLALQAALSARKVIACDINKDAVAGLKKATIQNKKIKVVESNLFSNIHTKFDLIIFNPPYLPEDKNESRETAIATCGGKKGYELIVKFLSQAWDYLTSNGRILLLFSSLTHQAVVDKAILQNHFLSTLLGTESHFFETLYVYHLEKNPLCMELEKKGIKNLQVFSRGKRGIIYTGKYKDKKVAIKAPHPASRNPQSIAHEIRLLRRIGPFKIGPTVLFSGSNYFVYEFVEGEFIVDWIARNKKSIIIRVLLCLFDQLFTLDQMGLQKEEMHHPHKHILVTRRRPVLIDFERCYLSKKPQNVTQFCQFLIIHTEILKKRGFGWNKSEIILKAKAYKNNPGRRTLNEIKHTIAGN